MVKDTWAMLHDTNAGLSPYQEYEYCSIVGKCPGLLMKYTIKNIIYELHDTHDQPVMLIPLHLEKTNTQTIAYLWGTFSQSGHLDLIYNNLIKTEAFMTALELIKRDIGTVKFVLNGIQERSRLHELFRPDVNNLNYSVKRSVCVQIPVPFSFDEYLNSLSKHARQNLRTSFNRLKTDHKSLEVKTFVNKPIPADVLVRLFTLYWKRCAEKQLPLGPKRLLPVFLRNLFNPTIRAFKLLANTFHSIVYIDKKIAGFCAGFSYREEKIIIPFLAIESAFSRYSPGMILVTETIKYLIEHHHYQYLDLSRGNEKYKYDCGGKDHFNYNYVIYPATVL